MSQSKPVPGNGQLGAAEVRCELADVLARRDVLVLVDTLGVRGTVVREAAVADTVVRGAVVGDTVVRRAVVARTVVPDAVVGDTVTRRTVDLLDRLVLVDAAGTGAGAGVFARLASNVDVGVELVDASGELDGCGAAAGADEPEHDDDVAISSNVATAIE